MLGRTGSLDLVQFQVLIYSKHGNICSDINRGISVLFWGFFCLFGGVFWAHVWAPRTENMMEVFRVPYLMSIRSQKAWSDGKTGLESTAEEEQSEQSHRPAASRLFIQLFCYMCLSLLFLHSGQATKAKRPTSMVPPSGRASAAHRTVKKYKQNYFSSHHTQSRVSKRSFVFSLLMPLCWVDRHCVARPGQFQPLYIQCGG